MENPVRAVAGQAKAFAPSIVPQYHRQANEGRPVPTVLTLLTGLRGANDERIDIRPATEPRKIAKVPVCVNRERPFLLDQQGLLPNN